MGSGERPTKPIGIGDDTRVNNTHVYMLKLKYEKREFWLFQSVHSPPVRWYIVYYRILLVVERHGRRDEVDKRKR